MKNVKTMTFNGETYRENFEAIVTRKNNEEEYIIAAFLSKEEAIEYARKQGKNVHVYKSCKAIDSKIQYDRFREINIKENE